MAFGPRSCRFPSGKIVCHIPVACRPGAAPALGGFGDLPPPAGARHVKWCGPPLLRRAVGPRRSFKDDRKSLLPCAAPPASQRWRRRILAIGPWPLEMERSAEPGYPAPSTLLVTVLRRQKQKPSGFYRAGKQLPSAGLHNKERTPLRALVFSYPQVFHGGCFGVSGTPPLRLFIYIFI